MSSARSQPDPDLICWDCGESNSSTARECWLCHRRDWRWPGLQPRTTIPASTTISSKPTPTAPRTPNRPGTTTPPTRDPPSTVPGWMVSLALMAVFAGILGLAPGLGIIGLFAVLFIWGTSNANRSHRRDESVSVIGPARPDVREQAINSSRQDEPTSGLLTVLSIAGLTIMMLTIVFVSAVFTAFLTICRAPGGVLSRLA